MKRPAFSTLEVSAAGPVGRLTLARPESLNAIGVTMLGELIEAARWFDALRDTKVVIIGGAGRAFSAGADLSLLAGADGADLVPRDAADAGRRMADAVEAMSSVTIAAIHGHCVGGGVVLAAACDLRIAAAGTVFRIPEIDLGLPLGWGGIPRLVREIGPVMTKELVMTGRPFDAAEALRVGFLNDVVPPADLGSTVDTLAHRLAAKPRNALLAAKAHTNAVTQQMVATGRSWADADGIVAALGDPESRAAAAAYLAGLVDED